MLAMGRSASGTKLAVPLLTALLLVLIPSPSRCLHFDLQSGHTKCISEEIKINAMAVGKYSVVDPSSPPDAHWQHGEQNQAKPQSLPDSHKVTARVTTPYGNSIHYADHVESGNFAFTSMEAGDYMACFWTPDHKPSVTVTIDFEWKSGVAAKDWSNVAKKGHIDIMELELKKLEDTIQSIHDEMFYLRTREEEMQDLNRSTNSQMAWLSFLSLTVCLSVAGLQLWHLKSFFEKKKLI